MNTTAESTALDDANRARRLPPDLLMRTNALLDELERLRAAQASQPAPDPAKAAAKSRAAYARDQRTSDKHAVIDAVIELHRPQLGHWSGTDTSRAKWLTKRITQDAPHWRYVYNYLKTMQF